MSGINLDPGLRQAFTQQTRQRLLTESTNARLAKCVIKDNPALNGVQKYTLQMKIKIIAQVIQEAGSTIITVLKANNSSANA